MIDNSAQVEQTQPTSPVSTGADGGAGGSQPPGTPTGTGTATGTPSGGATNASGGGGTGGTPNAGAGGSGGGGGGGGLIDAWGVVTDVWDGLVAGAINTTQSLIDMFSRSLLTLPAAGSIENPSSWFLSGVSDPNWTAMAGVYVLSSSLALVFLLISTSINLSMPRHQRRREVMVRFAWGLVAITIGFGMLQGYNHFWNGVAMGFAPSGEEFLSTPGNSAKFGAGLAAIAGLLMTGNAVAIAAGVLIHAAFVFLTYGLVALWPFSVGMYLSKAPVISEVGKATIVVTLALGPLQALKGVFLRVLFVLPIQPSNPETLFQFFVIVAGVAIAFTLMPYMGLKRLLPRTIVGVGMGGIQTATEETGKRLRDRAPSREQIQATLVGSDDNAARSKSKLGQRSGSATGAGSAAQSRGRNRRRSYRSTSRGLSRRSGADTRSRSQSRGGQSTHTGNVAYRQRRRRRSTAAGSESGSARQTRNRGGRGR